jgi:hypothetical protein
MAIALDALAALGFSAPKDKKGITARRLNSLNTSKPTVILAEAAYEFEEFGSETGVIVNACRNAQSTYAVNNLMRKMRLCPCLRFGSRFLAVRDDRVGARSGD